MDLHSNPSLPSSPPTVVLSDFDPTRVSAGSLTELWTRPWLPSCHSPHCPRRQTILCVCGAPCRLQWQTLDFHNTQGWARLMTENTLLILVPGMNTNSYSKSESITAQSNHHEYFGVYCSGITNSHSLSFPYLTLSLSRYVLIWNDIGHVLFYFFFKFQSECLPISANICPPYHF